MNLNIQIGKKDIFWNYIATFLKISSYLLLLPLILNRFPPDLVGVWSIFMAVNSISTLLDFGFNASFTRSVTLIFSGAQNLVKKGFVINDFNKEISYDLLGNLVDSMKKFYKWISYALLIILLTFGTFYIQKIVAKYHGSPTDVWIPWFLYCLLIAFSIYSVYIDVLMLGSGKVKAQKKISTIGSLIFIIISGFLLLLGLKLMALIIGQFLSVVVSRILSTKHFFTREIRVKLINSNKQKRNEILKILLPNSIKTGFTSVGSFLIQKSSIFLGSIYLSLVETGIYGITLQILTVISSLSVIYLNGMVPKITNLRVQQLKKDIWKIYKTGIFISLMTYVFFGIIVLLFGPYLFSLFSNNNHFPSFTFLALFFVLSFVETFISISGTILLTKNEVPFLTASIISGVCVVILTYMLFKLANLGVITLIISPLIVNLSFQAWKWPLYLKKSLH